MGEAKTIRVPARDGAEIGEVAAGASWRFSARGRWWDWFVPSGAGGYRFFLADILDIYPVSKGRPFFELTARVREHPEKLYPIGRGATVTFEQAGTVELFANDVEGFNWNNSGAVEVDYEPCDCPEPLPDHSQYDGLPGKWTLLRDTLDKTKGVGSTAILTLGAGAALAFTQQGRDLVRTVAEGDFSGGTAVRQIFFALTLLFLAVQTWIWPRLIILSNYGRDR